MHCLHWYGTALFTLLSYCIVYLSIVLRPTSTTQHLKNIKSGQFDPFPLVRVIDLKKHNIQIYLEYSVLETFVSDTHNSDRMILVSTVGTFILRMPHLFRVFNRGYRIKIKLICRLTKMEIKHWSWYSQYKSSRLRIVLIDFRGPRSRVCGGGGLRNRQMNMIHSNCAGQTGTLYLVSDLISY